MADYDLAIIGGGLNGISVARDAAGRGLRVILLEQGDLGSAASSASPRLIHGDLAMLERWAFLRVRAALAERDIWLRIAPHLVRPMRFALPAHSEERPPWLLRSGLWLYDRLGSARNLPGSATVDVTHHPIGNALKRPFGTAFEYSDCVVDDSRLVIANALDAAERGAVIRTGARCVRADRLATWRLVVIDRGRRQVITARALANATGAWTASVAEIVLSMPPPRAGAFQISHIIVGRLFDTDNIYVFQNVDRRLVFASPYIRTVSGANMGVSSRTRGTASDGAITFDARRGKAPLLTIFGGDITTSRLRAERAVSKLAPFYPMSPRWTANTPLPGGDFEWARFEAEVDRTRERWRFLSEAEAQRLVGAYGTRVAAVLGEAKERSDLGPAFGPELSGAEVRYLMAKEWARFPDDILWRRTKLGMTMPPADREALGAFMANAHV
ncbi:MAG: glycerol-3-phosphate dehydrogenase [Alphaproteobacteria bacterium]|nr:MAG: glycerol-3-phosphate dehydrogenase [Alphaproteobacteria bacterium]